MKEKIKTLFLMVASEDSYYTWEEDDEGRLDVIIDQVYFLLKTKNNFKQAVDDLISSLRDYDS